MILRSVAPRFSSLQFFAATTVAVLVLTVLPALDSAAAANSSSATRPVLRLATGGKTGTYFKLGQTLATTITNEDLEVSVEVLTTSGSVDNIQRLRDGRADLAIVQNDIAYLAERGQNPFSEPMDGLCALVMLYAEPILLVTTQPDLQWLSSSPPSPIAIGPQDSGLAYNSLTILKAAEAWDPAATVHLNPAQISTALESEQVRLAFLNTLNPDIRRLVTERQAHLVSLPTSLRRALTETYPFYESFELHAGQVTWRGVAVRSMIVARSDLDPELAGPLIKLLFERRQELISASQSGMTLDVSSNLAHGNPLRNWHPVAESFLRQRGVIPFSHPSTLVFIFGAALLIGLMAYLTLNLLAVLGRKGGRLRGWSRLFYLLKRFNLIVFRWKYLSLALLLATTFVYIVLCIEHLEKEWAITNNTISSFAQRDLTDNLLWMLVFSGSGYEDRLFPHSPEGKLLATMLPLVGVSGILAVVGFLTTDHIKRHILEIRGMRSRHMEEHILICGWSSSVPNLIRSLTNPKLKTRRPVMVLAETREENPLQAHGIEDPNVGFTRGSATRRADLERAHFSHASTAIVVADQGVADPDAINVLKILTLEKLSRELQEASGTAESRNIYTIAEISDPDNYETLARDAMVDEVVSVGHLESSILVQSALNHGVSTFLNEVLTFNEHNEFYSYRIRSRGCLMDLTYDELLPMLRKEGVLLLAISLECGGDRRRQQERIKACGLNRSVLSNPSSEIELNYRTRPGDLLIVLASSETDLKRAIQQARARLDTVGTPSPA